MPLYQIIKTYIRDQVTSGIWKAGDKVPSEHQLVKQFDVSRMTANRALRELQDEGLLVRVAGSGTFVASHRSHHEFLAIRDISEELAEQGYRHKVEVLSQKYVKADIELAQKFDVPIKTRLGFISILHYRNDEIILLEHRWVGPKLAVDFVEADFETQSTYSYLMERAPLQQVEHIVQAAPARPDIRAILKIEAGSACLVLKRRTWSDHKVASYADLIYVGARYEFFGAFSP